MPSEQRRILIVGGVAGGASAATRARRMNEHAEIVLFEKDEYVSFANCGLPYYIGGEITDREKLLVAKPELLRQRFKLDVRTRHEVLSIDRKAQTVSVIDHTSGKTTDEKYDRLILAPGASPLVPPIPGIDADNVLTLRNVADTDLIKARVDAMVAGSGEPKHVVVIGAGFIGLEMVEQLEARGLRITLVELQKQVLPLLDPEMASLLSAELDRHGITQILGDGIASMQTADGVATSATLSSGKTLDADLFILGIGVRPNTKLAEDAGLDLGPTRGIATNEYLQTNDPKIYAVGDAAEYVYTPTGASMRVPLAGPANRAGRIAGEHAATDAATIAMAPVLGTSVVRLFGLTAGLTGLTGNSAERFGVGVESVTIIANHHVGYYPGAKPITLKLTYAPDTGAVLGAQAIGAEGVDKRLDVIATVIQLDGDLEQLAGLDLAYAPPFGGAKDPIHMAAFTAINQQDGVVRFVDAGADLSGWQVVDMRTAAEVESGLLPGAVHIPIDELRDRLGELDAKRATLTVCASGLRSYAGARILMQRGFAEVADLAGGMVMRRHACPEEELVTPAPPAAARPPARPARAAPPTAGKLRGNRSNGRWE